MLWSVAAIGECEVQATDGPLGYSLDLLIDDVDWTVQSLVVECGSWLFRHKVLLSPEVFGEVDLEAETFAVNLSRRQVEQSEELHTDPPVSLQRSQARERRSGWVPVWPVAKLPRAPGLMPRGIPRPPLGDASLRSLVELDGYTVEAGDRSVGVVEDFLVDPEGWTIRYLVMRRGLPFARVRSVLATGWITEISWEQQAMRVDLAAEQVVDGPLYDPSAGLDRQAERQLFAHYGRRDPGLRPTTRDRAGDGGDGGP